MSDNYGWGAKASSVNVESRGSDPIACRQREVPALANSLEKVVAELRELVTILGNRLTPVTSVEPPAENACAPKPVYMTALGNTLADLRDEIERASRQIQNITSRLEV